MKLKSIRFPALLITVLLVLQCSVFTVYGDSKSEAASKEAVSREDASKSGAPGEKTEPVQPKPLLGKDALEKVIRMVKAKLEIPSGYDEFNSEVFDYGNGTSFRLRWSSRYSYYSASGGSLEVVVDEKGNFINYNHYRYYRDGEYSRRLPKITKTQALEAAKKFVNSLCPELIGEISFNADLGNSSVEYDGSYSFSFFRSHEGIPFYDNTVWVQVNGQTGEILSMNRNWNDRLVFPDTKGIITPGQAKEAYRKEIPLQLKYRRAYNPEKNTTYLEYSPNTVDMASAIDAVSGKKLVMGNVYNPYYDTSYRSAMFRRELAGSAQEVNLPQKELDELRQLEGLISVESAEKLVKGMTELGFDETFRINRYSYMRAGNGKYLLRLDMMGALSKEAFGKDIPEEKLKVMIAAGEGGRNANVTLDAKTSELIEFSSYGPFGGNGEKKMLDRAGMQKKVEAFLRKYKPAKFAQSELQETAPGMNEYMMKYGYGDPNNPGSFNFMRKVNGIPYADNQMNVIVYPGTGSITFFNEIWEQVEFISAQGIIGADRAHTVLMEQNPLQLRYVVVQTPEAQKEGMLSPDGNPSAGVLKLVYATDMRKPVCIEAKQGILINYQDGEPYRDRSTGAYDDIEGHPAKAAIQALAESGLLPAEKSFRPDAPMLQKEYLYIVAKIRGGYFADSGAYPLDQKEQDGMYRMLINEGLLDEDEKEPDGVIAKEDAVKYLLRAAGYRKFAEMQGVFRTDFPDSAEIDPKLIGYAAIAKSLKLVDGATDFQPKRKLTRAEAVSLLYKYMNR